VLQNLSQFNSAWNCSGWTSVYKIVTVLPTGLSFKRSRRNIQLFMPILVLTLIVLSCDVYLAVDKFRPVFCIIEWWCEIIIFVTLMQYCKIALIIRAILSVMYKISSRTFCKRLSRMNCDNFGTGALNVTRNEYSQTCTSLHKSRFVLRDEFEAFNGNQRNIKCPLLRKLKFCWNLEEFIITCANALNILISCMAYLFWYIYFLLL
jgi:hypothetical protein